MRAEATAERTIDACLASTMQANRLTRKSECRTTPTRDHRRIQRKPAMSPAHLKPNASDYE
ncbi:TPA: hypothetical protein QDC22_007943 [Burkholderia stabilis]|nr:hypothetical protein [Burkholderia stabilis]HDR9654011.1 hypothetical protein [Burkholderia stabilis]